MSQAEVVGLQVSHVDCAGSLKLFVAHRDKLLYLMKSEEHTAEFEFEQNTSICFSSMQKFLQHFLFLSVQLFLLFPPSMPSL